MESGHNAFYQKPRNTLISKGKEENNAHVVTPPPSSSTTY
jgi:hypothetical protein